MEGDEELKQETIKTLKHIMDIRQQQVFLKNYFLFFFLKILKKKNQKGKG